MSAASIRVILADDHAVVRKGIREFLTEPGDIEVIAEASDGDEAIALDGSDCSPMWPCSIFKCPGAAASTYAATCGRSTGRSAFSSSRLMMTIHMSWRCCKPARMVTC